MLPTSGLDAHTLAKWKEKCALTGEMDFARDLDKLYTRSGYPGILRAELNFDLAARASGEYSNPVGIAEMTKAVAESAAGVARRAAHR